MSLKARNLSILALILILGIGIAVSSPPIQPARAQTGPNLRPAITGGPLTVGFAGNITVTVFNEGNAATTDPSFVTAVTIPGGYAVDSATGAGWACASAPPIPFPAQAFSVTVNCTFTGALAQTTSTAVIFAVTPTAQAVGALNWQASITPPTAGELNIGNDTVTQAVTVNGSPDVVVSTSHNPATFTIGQVGAFGLTLTNQGSLGLLAGQASINGTASGAGSTFTITGAAGTNWSCTTTPTTYSCSNTAAIAAFSAAAVVTVTGNVTGTPGSVTLASTASTVGVAEPPLATGNNSSSDTATTIGPPNLTVAKTGSTTMVRGSNATYTLTVTNNGTGSTTGQIDITDTLPAGLTLVSFSSSDPTVTCTGTGTANVACQKTSVLAAAGSFTITLTVNVGAATANSISNTATVTTPGDSNPADNTSPAFNSTVGSVDVSVAQVQAVDGGGAALANFRVDSTGGVAQRYRFTVTNLGTSPTLLVPANNVVLTATLPTGVTVNTGLVNPANWDCITNTPAGSSTINCFRNGGVGLAAAASETIDIPLRVLPAAFPSVTISNATVVAASDSNAANNQQSAPLITPVVGADLTVLTITHAPDPFTATLPGTYDITIQNVGNNQSYAINGPGTTEFRVTVALPAGFTYNSFTGVGWNCVAGTPVTCTYGLTVAPGANANLLQITATPTSAGLAQVTTVTVFQTDDVGPTNNSATNSVNVNAAPAPDFDVAKTVIIPFVQLAPGQWQVFIRNIGAAATPTPWVVQDQMTVAGNFNVTAATSGVAGVTCTITGVTPSQTVSCTGTNPIPVGGSVSILITATGNSAGTFNNTAQMTAAPGDTNISNNTATIPTVVSPAPVPDLSPTITHSGGFCVNNPVVAPCGSGTYTVTVNNVGAAPTVGASNITVSLPINIDTVPVSPFGATAFGTWTCTSTGALGTGFVLACTHPAVIAAGGNDVLTIPVTMATPPITPPYSATTNVAVQNGTGGESNFTNNTASDTAVITAGAAPDVAITITQNPTPNFTSGVAATYTIGVTNVGSGATLAGDTVTVTTTLPASIAYTSGGGGGWTCSPTAGTNPVVCTRTGSLTSGAAYPNIVLNVMPSTAGPASTSTTVTGVTGDVQAANNTASISTTIIGSPDLQITKTHAPTNMIAGSPASYTITVQNVGTATTPVGGIITVADTINVADLTFVSATSATFGCNFVSPNLTCTRNTAMAPTNTATITVNVTPLATGSFPKNFPNVASVTITPTSPPGPSPDPNTANDTFTDPTVVTNTASADLSLTKLHTGNFLIGTTGTYTLRVQNVGTATFTGPITVVDVIPAPNLTFASATSIGPGTWTCSNAANTVTCSIPSVTLAANATTSFSITVNVVGPAATVTNTADITVGAPGDPNLSNDAANNGLDDPTVLATAPAASPTLSTITAAPTTVLADNTQVSTITVTARDTANALISGATVNLTGVGGLTISGPTTSSPGVYVFTARTATPGTYNIGATVNGTTISGTVAVTFLSTTGLSAASSTISASPSSVALNGTSTVTVNIKNNSGQNVAGAGVVLTYSSTTSVSGVTPASGTTGTTDANGNATFTMTSTVNVTITLTATASFGGTTITVPTNPTITWGSGSSGAATSTAATATGAAAGTSGTGTTFSCTNASIPADNVTTSTLTLKLVNSGGTALSGKNIQLNANPTLSGLTMQPASVATDANGNASFTIRSTTVGGPVTFTAVNTTDNQTISPTIQISFTAVGTQPQPCTGATAAPAGGVGGATAGQTGDGYVITSLLCMRVGPAFVYQRFPNAIRYRTVVRVLGRTTRNVRGLGLRDGCLKVGGPTWLLIQTPDGLTTWVNANYIRFFDRTAFGRLPRLIAPPPPGAPGAPGLPANATGSGPTPTPTRAP